MALFTAEELAELRRIDEEIDSDFRQTQAEIRESRQRDKVALLDRKDNKERKTSAQQAAYYEANKEKIAAQKAAYREANRKQYNAYMREYMRKRREQKKNAAPVVAGPKAAEVRGGPSSDPAVPGHLPPEEGMGVFPTLLE